MLVAVLSLFVCRKCVLGCVRYLFSFPRERDICLIYLPVLLWCTCDCLMSMVRIYLGDVSLLYSPPGLLLSADKGVIGVASHMNSMFVCLFVCERWRRREKFVVCIFQCT